MSKFSFLSFLLLCICFPAKSQELKKNIDSNISLKSWSCTPVVTDAIFQNSSHAWDEFLGNNIDWLIPCRNLAPVGTYTVSIFFIIDRDGNMTNVKAITKHGFGMEQEVIRIIESSPKWKPATQNGRPVKYYKRQEIIFTVPEPTLSIL
jgi:periplasmic protein TonB